MIDETLMPKEEREQLYELRGEYVNIAKELGYSDLVLIKLMNAYTSKEINNILIDARKGLASG